MINTDVYKRFALKKITIPSTIFRETEVHLRGHGRMGHEGMVLWTGNKNGQEAIVKSCIHPRQDCTAVSYDIPLEESQAINRLLEENGEVIIAQVHSHPGAAFHSSRDDAMPFTYSIGFLSLVVPNFCGGPLKAVTNFRTWEHLGAGRWRELLKVDVEQLFTIQGEGQ